MEETLLTHLRWMCLVLCFLTVATADYLGIPAHAITTAALIGAGLCGLGIYSDRVRTARMRWIEEELGHYKSAEYRKFRINQRSRAL